MQMRRAMALSLAGHNAGSGGASRVPHAVASRPQPNDERSIGADLPAHVVTEGWCHTHAVECRHCVNVGADDIPYT